jgi:hypothetical protein
MKLLTPTTLGLLLLFANHAMAAPFLQATVVSGVTSCGVFLDAAPKVVVSASGGTCKYDVSGVSNGSHTATMTAIASADPVWGTQESAPTPPFVFVRPGVPSSPSTLTLVP